MTRPRPVGEETVQDIQVMLRSDAHHASIRNLKVKHSDYVEMMTQLRWRYLGLWRMLNSPFRVRIHSVFLYVSE